METGSKIAPHVCKCGAPCYEGAFVVECTSDKCDHFHKGTAVAYKAEQRPQTRTYDAKDVEIEIAGQKVPGISMGPFTIDWDEDTQPQAIPVGPILGQDDQELEREIREAVDKAIADPYCSEADARALRQWRDELLRDYVNNMRASLFESIKVTGAVHTTRRQTGDPEDGQNTGVWVGAYDGYSSIRFDITIGAQGRTIWGQDMTPAEANALWERTQDLHTITAANIFGVPVDEVTPAQRHETKKQNFGSLFGAEAQRIGDEIRRAVDRQAGDWFKMPINSPGSLHAIRNALMVAIHETIERERPVAVAPPRIQVDTNGDRLDISIDFDQLVPR